MTNTHVDRGSGRALWVRWVVVIAVGVLAGVAGFVGIYLVDGVGIIVGPMRRRRRDRRGDGSIAPVRRPATV